MEQIVDLYNEDLACNTDRLERDGDGVGDGRNANQLEIDLAELIEQIQTVAAEQVTYMVDCAKADALDLIGETREAFKLRDRYG